MKLQKKQKYRELVELKGLMREKKITYEDMAKYLKIALSTFCNGINGKSGFNISQVDKIVKKLSIPKEKIYIYFF